MKSTGMVRRVDELGRIVLPKELRRTTGITEGEAVEIFIQGEQIILQKYSSTCVLCGGEEELVTYRDKQICLACLESIKQNY